MNPALVITEQEENGLRLQLLLDKCNETLRNFFHRFFSEDPQILYQQLSSVKSKLNVLKQTGRLSQTQWSLLFPKNSLTESSNFDITLISLLVREICQVRMPNTGWSKDPHLGDRSDGASLVRIRHARNYLQHHSLILQHSEYTSVWLKLSSSMITLGCAPQDISNIEQAALDVGTIGKLKQVEKELMSSKSTILHLQNCLESIWWNVSPNVHNFIGRDTDIKKLHNAIMNVGDSNYGTVIIGMGGVGKTEMAKQYCHVHGEEYFDNNVIWLDADGSNALESSFYKVAEYLEISVNDAYGNTSNIKTIVAKVYRFFARRKALFVFDNANNMNEIEDFLPTSLPLCVNKPVVLITSQFTDWGKNFVSQHLGTFPQETAEAFINSNLSNECCWNEDLVKKLATLTEFLPLALQQAISYIFRNQITIKKYIELFNENSKLVFSSSERGMQYKHTIFTTWSMALKKLLTSDSTDALQLIQLMSFMHGKSIQKNIFITNEMKETDLNEALSVLISYSLISISKQNNEVILKMHSLMQIVVRETAPAACPNIALDLLQKMIKLSLLDQFHFGDGWLEHVMNIFQVAPINTERIQRFFELHIYIKQALLNKGKYTECASFLSFIVEQIKVNVTPQMVHVFNDVQSDIAKSLQYAGRLEDAKIIFMNVIADEERLKRRGRVIMKRYALAICYLFQGNYTESYNTLVSVKEAIINTWGNLSPSLNGIDHGIALCLLNTGEYSKALKIFKVVEEYGEQNYKKTKMNEQYDVMRQEGMLPEVLTARSCMATCLQELGKKKKALRIFREVEKQRREDLGDFHPSTLQERCNTATCIAQKYSLKKGIALLKEVEEQQITVLEEKNHPHVLITQYNIAKSYMKRKRYEQALHVLIPLLENQCLVLGENHPKTINTRDNLLKCKGKVTKSRHCICIF